MGRRPKQTFLQRRHTVANWYMKRCSTSLIIKDMQINTTMRYHFTLVRKAITKKGAGEGVKKKEPCGKWYGDDLKN